MTARAERSRIAVRGEIGGWLDGSIDGVCVRTATGLAETWGPVDEASHLHGLALVRVNPDPAEGASAKALE